jgi:hypothetical protein
MNEYQSYGSGVTYFRRYALSSMLGLVTDKDTDAAGSSMPVAQAPKFRLDMLPNVHTEDELGLLYNSFKSSLTPSDLEAFKTRKQQLNK